MRDPLAYRVRASPDGTALVDAESGESWTFDALDRSVDRTAARLHDRGVEPGDRVGVVLPNRPAHAATTHALVRLGATLVPLSDRSTARELADRLSRAEPAAVVCGAGTESAAVEAADAPVVSVDDPAAGAAALADADGSVAVPRHEWRPSGTVALLFTSGTTGDPKPVALTATNLLASAGASALRLGVRPDDRWLVALPLDHAGGLSPVLRMPLYGSTVVLRRSFEPGPAVDDIAEHAVTCVPLVPTMLRRMLDARGVLPDSLRVVLLGGAPASPDLIERCRDYSVPVYPTYGTTETASQVATATPAEAFADPGTVGRPLFGTEVRAVDERGAERPPGEAGELVVSGPTVAPGYHGAPEATDDAFRADGFHTGDVGVVDGDGRVRVLGRLDDRIVTGGETVDPGEVAGALRDHPSVADAAVVGLPDEEWGERVAALVVPDGEPPDREALLAHCRDRLAGFKLPRTVAFADTLPRTASGTVDRDAVRERFDAGGAGAPAGRDGRDGHDGRDGRDGRDGTGSVGTGGAGAGVGGGDTDAEDGAGSGGNGDGAG
ncbi:MAG: class I adenylate-forming enzyme family protein [Haloferacaceae archaeon]